LDPSGKGLNARELRNWRGEEEADGVVVLTTHLSILGRSCLGSDKKWRRIDLRSARCVLKHRQIIHATDGL
jgi:hypothetical protein